MKKLMRRVAVVLALPLVVGAPVVLLAGPAQAAVTPGITLTQTANPSVYGQEVRVTAALTNGEGVAANAGSIQFVVDGVEQGPLVPVGADGKAISPPLFDEGGLPLDITIGSDFYAVQAQFFPTNPMDYNETNASYQQRVDKAGSTLAVLPSATTIVADLAGQLPGGVQFGSIKPSGTVAFTVDGAPVGSAPVSAEGRATLSYTVPPGAARIVGASYAGDDRYTASSHAMTRYDPSITARLLSRFPKSRSGWYSAPVEVLFFCRSQGSELTADCPLEVTLRKSGADQSVTQTVRAVDGGAATVVVAGIDIDRDDPEVSIVNGKCKATDELSGVKSCKLRRTADGAHLLAIATDKAGNRATARGELTDLTD
jgi:hypothetical protein